MWITRETNNNKKETLAETNIPFAHEKKDWSDRSFLDLMYMHRVNRKGLSKPCRQNLCQQNQKKRQFSTVITKITEQYNN